MNTLELATVVRRSGAALWLALNVSFLVACARDVGTGTSDPASHQTPDNPDAVRVVTTVGGAAWTPAEARTTADLRDVWAGRPDDAWAVGDGVALHWDGHAWASVPVPVTVNLRSVWGAQGDDVWMVGVSRTDGAGAVYHWDGAALGPVANEWNGGLAGVWGTARGDVWVVGAQRLQEQSNIWHFDGARWSNAHAGLGTPHALGGVAGSSAQTVWAVAPDVRIPAGLFRDAFIQWDGAAWSSVPVPLPWGSPEGEIRPPGRVGLWMASATDVWVTGLFDTMTHYDGHAWRTFPVVPPSPPVSPGDAVATDAFSLDAPAPGRRTLDVWGSSPVDVWVVGEAGLVSHWDGARWANVATSATQALRGVRGSSAGDVWAVGDHGTILHIAR